MSRWQLVRGGRGSTGRLRLCGRILFGRWCRHCVRGHDHAMRVVPGYIRLRGRRRSRHAVHLCGWVFLRRRHNRVRAEPHRALRDGRQRVRELLWPLLHRLRAAVFERAPEPRVRRRRLVDDAVATRVAPRRAGIHRGWWRRRRWRASRRRRRRRRCGGVRCRGSGRVDPGWGVCGSGWGWRRRVCEGRSGQLQVLCACTPRMHAAGCAYSPCCGCGARLSLTLRARAAASSFLNVTAAAGARGGYNAGSGSSGACGGGGGSGQSGGSGNVGGNGASGATWGSCGVGGGGGGGMGGAAATSGNCPDGGAALAYTLSTGEVITVSGGGGGGAAGSQGGAGGGGGAGAGGRGTAATNGGAAVAGSGSGGGGAGGGVYTTQTGGAGGSGHIRVIFPWSGSGVASYGAPAGNYCPSGGSSVSGVSCPVGYYCYGGVNDKAACTCAAGSYCPLSSFDAAGGSRGGCCVCF